MALYAIVIENDNKEQLVLNVGNQPMIFNEYSDAAKHVKENTDRLKHLLDGSPVNRGNFILGTYTTRNVVTEEQKSRWQRMIRTMQIKQIKEIKLFDDTFISKN